MLVDQIMIQPPMILLMYMSLDVVKAGLQEALPSIHRNLATLAPVVVDSWRFWPVALYIRYVQSHFAIFLDVGRKR
jgi:hypothetical protein